MPALSTSVLLAFMLAPPAKEPLDLKWKFTKSDEFYIAITEDSDTTATENGRTVPSGAGSRTVVFKIAVTDSNEKVTAFEVTFMSERAGHAAARKDIKLTDVTQKDGQTFTFMLRADGRVTKIRGNQELWKAAPGLRPAEVSGTLVANLFLVVPGRRATVGEAWDSRTEYPMADGLCELSARTTAEGVTDGLVKLVGETARTWDSQGTLNSMACDELKGEGGVRTVWFDLKAGRVQKMEDEYVVAGSLRAPWAATTVTHRFRVVTVVSDKPPKDE